MRIDRRTAIAGLLATLSGVAEAAHPVRAEAQLRKLKPLVAEEDVMLRIVGDDAAGSTLIPQIAANLLKLQGAGAVEILPAPSPWTIQVRGRVLPETEVSILIRATTTLEGYEWLNSGKADVWLAARSATPTEMDGLRAVGKPRFARIARFALVVMVHPDNPIESLTHDQVRDIYTGSVTDWSEVGGPAGPIHAYGRSAGTANEGTFAEFFYDESEVSGLVRHVPLFTDMNREIIRDRHGIGYLATSHDTGLKRVLLTIDGRVTSLPDAYGLETEDYPLANSLFLYRLERPGMDMAEAFVREARSPRSEYLMMRMGFRAAETHLLWPPAPRQLPARTGLGATTLNAVRVNVTIHFPGDSDELDDTALQDVRELVRYLRRLSIPTGGLVHTCHSENSGDLGLNRFMSLRLGQIFAAALREQNFVAGELVPFGSALPLADDITPAGRRANRRIETWIRP